MGHFTTVAKVGDIPSGHGLAVEVNERIVAIFNDHGEYFAIDDCCPHMGASLADGELQQSVVACPWHGWRFDVRDGTWCDNRRVQIDRFEVRVVGEMIQVCVPERPEPDPDHSQTPA